MHSAVLRRQNISLTLITQRSGSADTSENDYIYTKKKLYGCSSGGGRYYGMEPSICPSIYLCTDYYIDGPLLLTSD